MGKWHRPYQTALIIKKIQLDIDPRILYEYEYSLGWSDASTFSYYWENLKDRIIKLTGRNVYSYIKLDTINYRKFIESRNSYLSIMAKKNQKKSREEVRKELYEKLDKEDIWIINEAYEERIRELEEELEKQKKIKSKCLTVIKIQSNYKRYKRRFNKTLICDVVDIARRTFNDKLKKANLFTDRKIRKDSISNTPQIGRASCRERV